MPDKLLKWIGPFRVISHLGSGATGEVFLAEDPSLGRKVAIKILKKEFKYNAEFRNRFLREARSMASLTSPNVVNVHAIGDEEGMPYMVMEYMDGNDLLTHIEKNGALPVQQAIEIFIDVLSGLRSASAYKIIHRDIKPANIFLTAGNTAKIGDFGLARAEIDSSMTADGVVIGTPDYLAPEVIEGKKSTIKSDIYSLACSFYHVVAGHPPFRENNEDATSGEVLSRQLKTPPPTLKVEGTPRILRKLLLNMMDKDPDLRPGYDKVIEIFKRSMRSETLTISIPTLSTITQSLRRADSDPYEVVSDDDFLPFPSIVLVLMGIAAGILIIAGGIILFN